ncbi:MAG: hypothetical protein ACP5UA_12525 [Candidatus Hydrogenedens sp.]
MKSKIMQKVLLGFFAILLVSGLFVFYGCGGPAEQTPPPKPPEPKELTLPPAEGGVPTTSLLKLTPENAQLSIALPSLADGLDKIAQTAKRFYPADEVDGWLQNQIRQLANFADVPEAKSLIEVAEARGFDITQPISAFLDFKPSFDSIQALLTPPEGETADKKVDIEKIDWKQVKQPNWAVMLGVKDADKVETSLKDLVIEIPEINTIAPQEVIVDGAKIMDYGVYAYFIGGNYVTVGSSSMVKGVANRFKSPYAIRYGVDIPTAPYPEGVVLVKDRELIPLLNQLMPTLVQSSPYALMGQLKISAWSEMLPEYQDPVYVCFSLNPSEKLEIRTLMDLSKRPKAAGILGEAKPMELPKILPDNTQATLLLQFTNEYKTYLNQSALPEVKKALSNKKEVAQGLQYGVSAMGLLGNEMGVAITSAMGDFPALIVIIQASNVEQVKGLLDMLIPSMSDENYRDIPLKKLAVPSPIPITLVMVEDKVIASNNTDVLKKMIDMVLDKQTSGYMAGLKPALDPSIPRYNLISIQSKLLLDTIFPLMSIMGQDLGGAQRDVEKVLSEIQELRIMNEKKNNLLEGQVTAYFVSKAN